MLGLLIWQVILGHPWGKQPMSNANVIGWTMFLWLIYFRLITVRLVTEVRDREADHRHARAVAFAPRSTR